MSFHWHNHMPMVSHGILNPTMRVLSYGGGRQTNALLLAAEKGLIGPKPDVAIMGKTPESRRVWAYIDEHIRPRVSIEIVITQKEDLLDHIRRSKLPDGGRTLALPYYTLGSKGEKGLAMRQCTADAKIDAVTQEIRRRLKVEPGRRPPMDTLVEVWIGISTDEWKDRAGGFPAKPWQHVRYPLLEMGWSTADCQDFLVSEGLPESPQSLCFFCPFHDNAMWRAMKEETPDEFEAACEIDDYLRSGGTPPNGMTDMPYLHDSRKPLRDVDLTAPSMGFKFDCMGGCGT